jgi:hypothetical protein
MDRPTDRHELDAQSESQMNGQTERQTEVRQAGHTKIVKSNIQSLLHLSFF